MKNRFFGFALMRAWICVIVLLSPWRAFSQGTQQKINVAMTSSATLEAWLHLPDDYGQTSQQYPLLIFIHGVGEGGNINDVLRHGVPKMIAKGANMQYTVGGKLFKFITVSPRIAGGWANYQTVQKLIEEMKKLYRVDASRIYLTGLSAGGYGVLNYITTGKEYSDNIAAIVPVSSAPIDDPKLPGLCNVAASNMAVWMLCGTSDGFLKYQTDYISRINACNPAIKAKATTFTGGHDSGFWDKAYDPGHTYQSQNIYEWMLQYSKDGSSEEPPPVTAPVAEVKNANVTLTLPTASVMLDGSGSTAPNSSISTYAWKQVSGPGSATIAGGATSKATVGQLVAGKYVFSLTVTNAAGQTNIAYANVTVNAASTGTDCENCKVVITPGNDGGAYINGNNYTIEPGDTICVKAGNYAYIQFMNFTGSADKPLVFINCGGQVRVGDGGNYGLIFNNVKYFKITGSGSADKYGFRIDGVSKRLSTGLAMGKGCTDYEAERIEITGSEAGLMAKVNPDCDPMNQYPNFAIRNISIHDIYIHDVLGEGMYIGNTAPNGTPTVCDGVTKNLLPPRIYNLKVYNNITENTGWDGIQVASAPENVEIYNNSVYNFGTVNKGSQQAGIILGGESNGKVYNNKIIKGTGNALEVFGVGLCLVYNNIIADAGFDGTAAGQDALFVDDRPTDHNFKPLQVYILNNTVVNSARDAIRVLNSFGTIGTGNLIQNNLVFNTGSGAHVAVQRGIDAVTTSNVTGQDINTAGFVNAAGKDFHITATSVAVNKGLDFKAYFNYDIDGQARPQGAAFDAGADEYSTGSTNKPPVANAGSAVTITLPVTTANLDGSASADPDGSIASYAWTFVSGPVTPGFGSASASKTTVTGLTTAGSYVFQLAVTDNSGSRATAQVTVTVQAAALPPTVNAGTDKSIRLPATTSSLSGTASASGGATISTYAWTQISGPATSVIASPGTAASAISGLTAQGAYDFRLTVTDSKGASKSDTIRVTVLPAYTGPTANAGTAISIRLPETTASLTGSGTPAAGSTISTYAWTQTAGPVTAVIATPAAATTNLTGLTTAGTYTFRLTVTDDKGLTASATVNVVVSPAFIGPEADAGENLSITLPVTTATLNGSGTPAQGNTISSYAWEQTAGPATATIANPAAATTGLTGLATAGTYTFRITVKDNNGLSASATVDVQVLPANVPPVADAGGSQRLTLPVSTATLTGTGTAASGSSIISYAWTQVSGPRTATLATANAASTGVSGLTTAGTYIFRLTVTDDKGLTGTATVEIVVAPANEPPVVDAGNDQSITLPATTATLRGTATPASGSSIETYAWSQVSGPVTATISASAAATTGVSQLTQSGTYTFRLTATDDKGLSASATVTIQVSPANTVPPVVNAGNAQTITLPVTTATVSGSATAASGSSIASYAWTQVSGPATATFANNGSASTGISRLTQAGTYTFRLTATDDKGLSASATVTVTVNPANEPPVVNAGNNQSITLPATTATLNGSATPASGSSIETYAWAQISGPVTATIASSGAASTGISRLTQAGTYTFRLTATDDKGLSASATVTVTVNPANNIPPVVNAGSAQTITLPATTATLNGSATPASGSSIETYAWAQTSGPVTATIASSGSASTGISRLTQAGTYTFRLTATDDKGLSASATVTVTVNPANNIPPVVNAGSAQTITLPATTATLTGSATAASGSNIASYAWTQVSGPATATFGASSSASTGVSRLTQAGTYTFRLTATDNNGLSASATVTVTVNQAANIAPVADAGGDQEITLPESTATLNGQASRDEDGSIASWNWAQVSGPSTSVIANPGEASTSVQQLSTAGVYVFELTVTDNRGATSKDRVSITVNIPLDPPVADAGADQVLILPETVINLNGSGSRPAPNSNITGYKWELVGGDASKVTISNASASASFAVLRAAGSYTFRLTVMDANGRTATDNMVVTVQTDEDQNHSENVTVDMSPNPVQDQLRVAIKLPGEQPVSLRIFNFSGALQATHQLGTIINTVKYIDMSAYTGGMYIIQVQVGPHHQESFKIMKAK
ncbi:PKD domain-containing protein [Chitinophaga pollutisoli]|uniref:PKD domain-containing protein n=1 Tax=Chitinophaga pollutisoli TaxID=3133966 RepID=A0ABZ2YPP0_9BACT